MFFASFLHQNVTFTFLSEDNDVHLLKKKADWLKKFVEVMIFSYFCRIIETVKDMKRILLALLFSASALLAYPRYIGDVNNDNRINVSDVMLLVNIILGNNNDYEMIVADVNEDGKVNVTDVMCLIKIILGEDTPKEIEEVDALYVTYSDSGASYQMPSAWRNDVTVTINNGHVSIVNTNTTQEYVTVLSGTSDNGSLTYTGSYKTTIRLNGLTLTNPTGGCIDIEDGKRVSLEIVDGTDNSLTDGEGNQKAALYCKGHLEVSGGGTLDVTSQQKHAIRSKEYMELKKSAGTIHILRSVGDGIHAGQYFEMKGGTVTMDEVAGDGIQVEALLEGDDNDGQLTIKGGTLNITLIGSDASALKCDSLMTISGGIFTINSTGDDVKALKSKSDIHISGGTLSFTQSGGYLINEVTTDGETVSDPSFTAAVKSDGSILVTGGDITVRSTADGGRGLAADGNITISGGTLDVTANGSGGILDLNNSGSTARSYRLYVALPTSGGGGGSFGGRSAWTNVYLYDSDNNMVTQLTNQASFTVNGQTKTFYYHDFGGETTGSYYFKSDDYRSGGGGGSTYAIQSASFTLSLTGSDAFYNISNNYQTSGSKRTYSISNVTSTYADAVTATVEGDTYKAFCLKADGNITVDDGGITLSHNGIISKGLKADGTISINGGTITDAVGGTYMIIGTDPSYSTAIKAQNYIGTGGEINITATGDASRGISADGTLDISGGTYDITLSGDGATYTGNGETEGAGSRGLKSDGNMTLKGGTITILSSARGGKGIKVGTSSVTGAQGSQLIIGDETETGTGPTLTVSTTGSYLSTSSGGGMEEDYIGSCKAVKCMGPITIHGGEIYLSTTNKSGEGLESKSTITINGGTIESDTYDDAINAAATITFNGGNTWAHASGNDAIDSNDKTTGIVINGGVVIASGTSSPEEGFDCDNAAFIINGGTVIGTGGSQGGGMGGGGMPTSATQAYASLSSVSLTKGTYLSLKDNSGSVIFSYKLPQAVSRGNILVSSPSLSKGKTATIVYGSNSISNPVFSLWEGVYTTGATLSGGTSTSVTPK